MDQAYQAKVFAQDPLLGPSYTFIQIRQGKKIYVDSKRVKHSLEIKIFCLSDNFWLNDLVEFAPRQLSQTFIVDGTTGVFSTDGFMFKA